LLHTEGLDYTKREAKIMEAIGPERVYSFLIISINDKVTACDMKKVPLADEALDVAIFLLSLMGKKWSEYIREAKRCLVTNDILMIAETTKSMKRTRTKKEKTLLLLKQESYDISFVA
jgi:ribosomal RNA-processing protein 8